MVQVEQQQVDLDIAKQKVYQAFLEGIAEQLQGSQELEQVWNVLQECSVTGDDGEQWLTYPGFLQAASQCRTILGDRVETILCPTAFLRLHRDDQCRVLVRVLFQYLIQRATLLNLRFQLARFDDDADGYLTPDQLLEYVADTASQITQITQFTQQLSLGEYSDLALRKLLFWHHRGGRIAIGELLSSKPLRELLAVADLDYEHMTAPPDNWFSVHSLLALRGGFAELDKDGDGLLTLEEFAGLSMGTMSKLFVERVFERFSKSMQGRLVMDLYGFVDFMLAWDGRATVQGMAVLFPVFDLDNKGYLNEVCWVCWGMSSSDEGCVQPLEGTLMDVQTVKPTRRNNTPFHKTLSKADLYTFLREIHELWLSFGQTADLQLMDMVADVVDIVRPRDRQQIRATDILRCGMPATLVGMLADVNTFWEYENRESLQQQQQQDAQGGDDLEVV